MTIEQSLTEALQTVVTERVTEIIDEEIKRVAGVVETRIRAEVGRISAQAFSHYTLHRMGPEFVIRVEFPGAKE